MNKKLFLCGVVCTTICSTLAYAITAEGKRTDVVTTASSSTTSEEGSPSYGVSIGTVKAQPYSGSGLNLKNFSGVEYVAKTSEGTYLGFEAQGDWEYNEETGEEYKIIHSMAFTAISSTEDAVTIPDSITVSETVDNVIVEKTYPITAIYNDYSNFYNGFTSNIKALTIPSTITQINIDSDFGRYLNGIYMLGSAPQSGWSSFNELNIYICNRDNLASYLNSDSFSNSTLIPYGWDYEWVTVNVEKNGEFAETYLTQNNYDWDAAQYVKVTGNINDIDLSAIKNLTSLMKLDLSETTITSLPEYFMQGRKSLIEVKLPSTLENIGKSAFSGCSSLLSFDLNGITTIENSVFYGCKSLTYINLYEVQNIGSNAFSECSNLNNIDLTTVVNIESSAFSNCYSLESIDLTSALKIESSAFSSCTSLKDIILGDNLKVIKSECFRNTAIESIIIPENITTISNYAFQACSSLSQVVMKKGLTSIGSNAFYGCTALEDITIPSTVKSIGHSAFANTGIKSFKCYAVVPPTAYDSFIGGDMDMSRTYLYVPPFSKDFYRNTQYWSNFYLMRSIEDPIDYIFVDRPLTINLEEEDNDVVANNPEIVLTYSSNQNINAIGQLTATGEGTLSAGQMTINATLAERSNKYNQNCPTLINYADKMRADNITLNLSLRDYYNEGQWHFISIPFDAKVSDIVPSNNTYWTIRRYDSAARAAGETDATWVNLTNDDTMEAGKGYIVSAVGGESYTDEYGDKHNAYPCLAFTSGNSLTKNNLFRPTDIIVPLSEYEAEFAHNRSWNLIGNPYPCYFDMHYLNEEFTAPVTVWNGNSYVAYSPVDDDLVLSPYEAFFVQCPLDAKEIVFKESGRLHSSEGKDKYNIKQRTAPSAEERNVFNFNISNEKFSDRARIVLTPDATMNYDLGRDASKFFADNSDCAQLYVVSDVNYSISERPVDNGTATLGLRSSKEEVYTLSLSGRHSTEWHVIVTDNVTGTSVDLTEGDYQFTTAKGDSNNRFSVRFLRENVTNITSLISDFGKDTNVSVTSVNGVTVYEGKMSEMEVPVAGLYIISNGKESRKAFLK